MIPRLIQNVSIVIICGVIMIASGTVDFFPWWIFLLPILFLGFVLTLLKWDVNAFGSGFIAGFLIWFGGNFLFDIQYDGYTLVRLGKLLSVPKVLLFLVSGIIGGLLTGTAMYIGKNIFRDNQLPDLE